MASKISIVDTWKLVGGYLFSSHFHQQWHRSSDAATMAPPKEKKVKKGTPPPIDKLLIPAIGLTLAMLAYQFLKGVGADVRHRAFSMSPVPFLVEVHDEWLCPLLLTCSRDLCFLNLVETLSLSLSLGMSCYRSCRYVASMSTMSSRSVMSFLGKVVLASHMQYYAMQTTQSYPSRPYFLTPTKMEAHRLNFDCWIVPMSCRVRASQWPIGSIWI
jgi:hypothetical protein